MVGGDPNPRLPKQSTISSSSHTGFVSTLGLGVANNHVAHARFLPMHTVGESVTDDRHISHDDTTNKLHARQVEFGMICVLKGVAMHYIGDHQVLVVQTFHIMIRLHVLIAEWIFNV